MNEAVDLMNVPWHTRIGMTIRFGLHYSLETKNTFLYYSWSVRSLALNSFQDSIDNGRIYILRDRIIYKVRHIGADRNDWDNVLGHNNKTFYKMYIIITFYSGVRLHSRGFRIVSSNSRTVNVVSNGVQVVTYSSLIYNGFIFLRH